MAHSSLIGRPGRVGATVRERRSALLVSPSQKRAKKAEVNSQSLCRHIGACAFVRSPENAIAERAAVGSETRPCVVGWAGLQRLGPRAAQRSLAATIGSDEDRKKWVEDAKLHAILGSMSLSLDSLMSGLRCYVAFVGWTVSGTRGSPLFHDCVCRTYISRGPPVFPTATGYNLSVVGHVPLWGNVSQLPRLRENRMHGNE